MQKNFLPISIDITDKKIVIIGGGKVAFHKSAILSRFTPEATVIAPEFHPEFENLPFQLIKKEYEADDLNGAFLVYICTGNETLNQQIKTACGKRGILASVCDNPLLCDFISPAIQKEENMTIAVSSNAQNVRQAIAVRNQIQVLIEKEILKIK
ncbi:porphyrin biosynthesis protein [Bacteroidia bacterium]|nr:porphyrin biosynthesis protein [Bacteroidia bacterium]